MFCKIKTTCIAATSFCLGLAVGFVVKSKKDKVRENQIKQVKDLVKKL